MFDCETEIRRIWDAYEQNNTITTKSLEEIRVKQQCQLHDKKRAKRDYAVQYTRKEFAPYVADEDLERL